MSSCPNCHQTVAPGDDICENCGAVLSTVVASQARFVTIPSTPSTLVGSTTIVPNVCPTCQTLVKPRSEERRVGEEC